MEPLSEPSFSNPLCKELAIAHIGTLVLLGQGPVQDSATKFTLEKIPAGNAEPNTWMSMIARAGAQLFKTGEVDRIITSGRATGGTGPTEAGLMETSIRNLTTRIIKSVEIIQEPEARNTLYNFINTANIIDARGDKDPITIVCAHFQAPRVRGLAALFGFDPNRVISAEEVLTASAHVALQGPRGEHFDPAGFDRQATMLELLRIRLGDDRAYFDRKKARAVQNMRNLGIQDTDALFVEEQKSAVDRMMGERRWVRGLAMEPDYIVPLLGQLNDDTRFRLALSHFSKDMLQTRYGIDPNAMSASDIRALLDPAQWSWQVVKEEWAGQEYPPSVMDRLQSLGISGEDRERLSKAEVPEIRLIGSSV